MQPNSPTLFLAGYSAIPVVFAQVNQGVLDSISKLGKAAISISKLEFFDGTSSGETASNIHDVLGIMCGVEAKEHLEHTKSASR